MHLFLLVACAGKAQDQEPVGLSMLEDLQASPPAAVDGDDTPETVNVVTGGADDYDWAHGDGYVDLPLDSVVTAFQDPDVGVDRRRISAWEVEYDTNANYDLSYTVTNHSDEIIQVDFDVTWGHGAAEANPDGVAAVWSKTDGTEFITVLQGSAQLLPVDDGTTEVQLIYHLSTVDSDETDAAEYLTDFYGSILAVAHGEALPTYEDS